jgi:type I restriction-modification system DNA methylase subunit
VSDTFASEQHEKLFRAVLYQLDLLGYEDELLCRSYKFTDWFQNHAPPRVAPAAAFGNTPQSYDTACFAVLLPNDRLGAELVTDYRALGAPIALEVREDLVVCWKVAQDLAHTKEELRISRDALEQVFRDHKPQWRAQDSVSRLKNIRFDHAPRQMEFDLGLIPALEKQIQERLGPLLRSVLAEADKTYRLNTSHGPNEKELSRLVFRFLAAKILHDRGQFPFSSLSDSSDADAVLKMVGKYYGEEDLPLPLAEDRDSRQIVAQVLWDRVDFRNLSVEVLAYIYEETLVDEVSRKFRGTHRTPYNIARYIVHHLPFDKFNKHSPLVLEPFAGHGIFLVAALQRLRDALPPDMDEAERHRYFVKRLRGYELESFAVEVSRLCLMLADFPNRNGWKLYNEDVFLSERFINDLGEAGVVLCNPPFQDFSFEERQSYRGLRSVSKPAEVLLRVMDHLSPSGTLGIVLPRAFLDGVSYREIRKRLVERFEDIETVALPDGVFRFSRHPSALLLAKAPSKQSKQNVSVTYTYVRDSDRERFLREYAYTRRDHELKPLADAQHDLMVVPLRDIWTCLSHSSKLEDVADIHRGVEWQAPFDPEKYTSQVAKDGFALGVLRAEGAEAFLSQPTIFLCTNPEYRLWKAWDLSWDRPKVLLNAVRVSGGPWRLAAFADYNKLIASQDFIALWPKNQWSLEALAAVVNGPIANAFTTSRELGRKHNRITTIEKIPVPELGTSDVQAITSLVRKYTESLQSFPKTQPNLPVLWVPPDKAQEAERLLWEIDATVLKAYNLSPRLERELLEYFRGERRPTRHEWRHWFPEDFQPFIPLHEYLSSDHLKASRPWLLDVFAPLPEEEAVLLRDYLE